MAAKGSKKKLVESIKKVYMVLWELKVIWMIANQRI